MSPKAVLALLSMAFVITAALLAGAYLFLSVYLYALTGAGVAIVAMEVYLRLSEVKKRVPLFYAYLVANVIFLGALYALTRTPDSALLTPLAYLSFLTMAAAGGILLRRTHVAAHAASVTKEAESA